MKTLYFLRSSKVILQNLQDFRRPALRTALAQVRENLFTIEPNVIEIAAGGAGVHAKL